MKLLLIEDERDLNNALDNKLSIPLTALACYGETLFFQVFYNDGT